MPELPNRLERAWLAGIRAFEAGQSRAANPFTDEQEKQQWRAGWNLAETVLQHCPAPSC